MIIEVFVGIPGLSDVEIGGSIAADPFEKRKAKNTSRLRISTMKTVMRFFILKSCKDWYDSLLEVSRCLAQQTGGLGIITNEE